MKYHIVVTDSNHVVLADTDLEAEDEKAAHDAGWNWFNLMHGEKARQVIIVLVTEAPR